MTEDTHSTSRQDESAVAAVRGGDTERYRELVERHERRVFAVAWSRLGDAALAEEATQEAFIRAYRRLCLLGDGAKFSGWVSTIARRIAINFGLRHRRELNKRERWALEYPEGATAAPSDDEGDPLHTPETLRQTLAELPDAHRECLVLFYLEGQSGAEAAVTLGISEAALRVRLHRARAAMRERLEAKLESSLTKLRPAETLSPAVMAGVLASSTAKAATTGGVAVKVLGTLAKFTPCKWLFALLSSLPLFLPAIMFLPAWLMHRWRMRDEQRNFRDPKGFRATLHRQFDHRGLVVIALVFVLMFLLMAHARPRFGVNAPFLIIGLFSLFNSLVVARRFQINSSGSQIGLFFNGLIMASTCLSVWLGWLPVSAVILAVLLSSVLTIFSKQTRLMRMDYNLFLRASQGMLPPGNENSPTQYSPRLDRSALRAFARFLGERQLVNDFYWEFKGLKLFLTGMKSPLASHWHRVFPSVNGSSHLTLGWDGSVTARCEENDSAGLEAIHHDSSADLDQLERQVAQAVSRAWRYFREGKSVLAERAVGQIPETDIFIVPPSRINANRWQRIFVLGLVGLSLCLMSASWFLKERLSGLKPVAVTEVRVRAFLNDITPNPAPHPFNRADLALDECLVLAPTNLFTREAWNALQIQIFSAVGFNPQGDKSARFLPFQNCWMMHKAMEGGWVGWGDVGLTPQEANAYLHRIGTKGWQFRLVHEAAWSWVESKNWDVERINDFTLNQLRWLRDVNCLDLVDREKVIRQITSVQVRSGTPPSQPPIHDWQDVRGLFVTPCWPALQDTYDSLAALEILGGLDRMDREACIEGILKRHAGGGFFTSPESGSYNEYHIDGSARDTIAAFESLRILGALDRVKDLEQWKFRPLRRGVAENQLTWGDVEAWVCQQRLAKILRERKEHPQAPVGSLLPPAAN